MIRCEETDGILRIETSEIRADITPTGYVSGIMRGTFHDKKTGLRDPGSGLHVMDFLLAPGWREDDTYTRDPRTHGNLPKHYVEGPQICTRARRLDHTVIRGEHHLAVKLGFTFTQPGRGYRAGSRWEQTLVFLPHTRYILSSETILCANDADALFYRIDMPGHLKHDRGDTFREIYLSYHGHIQNTEFLDAFAPDERYFYARDDARIPDRFIRAYLLAKETAPAAWLAGMTLDPAAPGEAWCHQRGYVCFIQENHRRPVSAGQTIGAAYVIGYFDTLEDAHTVYDDLKGVQSIDVTADHLRLLDYIPQTS